MCPTSVYGPIINQNYLAVVEILIRYILVRIGVTEVVKIGIIFHHLNISFCCINSSMRLSTRSNQSNIESCTRYA